jgi:hypothetical protein
MVASRQFHSRSETNCAPLHLCRRDQLTRPPTLLERPSEEPLRPLDGLLSNPLPGRLVRSQPHPACDDAWRGVVMPWQYPSG